LTHPTETERKYSPSRVSPWTPWIDGAFNRVFGIIFACAGFNVVIPDYPGMGDNYQVHPYCLKSLGKSAATMVDAVRKEFTTDTSQTYIMGFSEGGYAALATAQYMMAHPKNKYNLKAVAALSGPYDLKNPDPEGQDLGCP
jgi:pimeloyl-ACP methyl ester carboxylesterase